MAVWEAVNENPRVFCAVAETPAQAFEEMAEILYDNNVPFVTATTTHHTNENEFTIIVYI